MSPGSRARALVSTGAGLATAIVALVAPVAMVAIASLPACGDDPRPTRDAGAAPAAVTKLVGEIHLHQFPLGSHAWAAFLAEPVPTDRTVGDQLVAYEPAPTLVDGPCTLYVQPTCTPRCGADTICLAHDVCTPLRPVRYIDGGDVDVTGSSLHDRIHMFFVDARGPYDADPAPGRGQLFAGGERLEVRGGRGDLAFGGVLAAPQAVRVTDPDLARDLRLPPDAPLTLAWDSDRSLQIVVLISVSSSVDGRAADIRCSTSDTGGLTIPRAMIAALPPPPRDERLEIERNDERTFSTGRPGVGVIVHVAQSTWKNGTE